MGFPGGSVVKNPLKQRREKWKWDGEMALIKAGSPSFFVWGSYGCNMGSEGNAKETYLE